MSPISRHDKDSFLLSYANECDADIKNRYDRLRHTHDLLGLASKALYLDMMKEIMLKKGEFGKLDNNMDIYNSYIENTLNRKHEYLEVDGHAVNLEVVFDRLTLLMEDIALIMFRSCPHGISIDNILKYHEDMLATRLWIEITSPTPINNEDAENRIINRSLLKVADQDGAYIFCHRSMQEYFAAKGLCRLISESPEKAEEFLSNVDLTYETIGFAALLIKSLLNKTNEFKSSLISFIVKTRGQSQNNMSIVRLGATAISLYYKAWNTLPEIDFRNLVLDNAYLPEADFSSKHLIGSSLRNATLDNASFINANLTECDLTGVRFEETKDIYSMCVINDLLDGELYLYVLYSDGILRKWNIINNKREEVGKINIGTAFICNPCFGLVFLHNSYIFYTNVTKKGLVLQGGIPLGNNTTVYDIKNDIILYSNNNLLFLYNFLEQKYIFEKHQILIQSKAIIVDDLSVLIYNDDAGLRLVTISGGKLIEKNLIASLKEENINDITTVSVIMNDRFYGLLRICIGYKHEGLFIYDLNSLSDHKSDDNTLYLSKISVFQCKQYIKITCFINFTRIVYTGTDGIIHVLEIDEYDKMIEKKQWRLAVRSRGAILNGVKQKEQYEKLKYYRDSD